MGIPAVNNGTLATLSNGSSTINVALPGDSRWTFAGFPVCTVASLAAAGITASAPLSAKVTIGGSPVVLVGCALAQGGFTGVVPPGAAAVKGTFV